VAKRAFDIVASAAALVVLGPVLLFLALVVIFVSGRPAFYLGWRAGRRGVPFRIIKLRTMVTDAELRGGAETPADDPRITRVGALLRRYKLDELPQLINVLIGDMSLVGPRPEVLDEVRRYGDRERALLSVRPGLTDWASIKFRHEGEILRGAPDPGKIYHETIQPEKIRLGLKYVQERSMFTDLAIIVSTLKAIVE
jgi:lipopolysaccharide/colanic/teichoic acid biosynthesis glycosyltransferase